MSRDIERNGIVMYLYRYVFPQVGDVSVAYVVDGL